MDAKLVVVGGDAKATEVKLRLPMVIGRGRGAGITIPHPLVSRQHCEILENGGQLLVRDMGSLNGTFVGDRAVRQEDGLVPLPPGALLTIGTVTFRAVYGDAPDLSPPSVPAGQDDETIRQPTGSDTAQANEEVIDISFEEILEEEPAAAPETPAAAEPQPASDTDLLDVEDVEIEEVEEVEIEEVEFETEQAEGAAPSPPGEAPREGESESGDDDSLNSFFRDLK